MVAESYNSVRVIPTIPSKKTYYDITMNLAPGAIGRYTCFEGYTLISFDEDGRYEYACTEDGIWDGNVTTVPVRCQCKLEGNLLCWLITSSQLIEGKVGYTCIRFIL